MSPRSAAELAAVDDPAWPDIEYAIALNNTDLVILPVDRARGLAVLESLQQTVRSTMGALALNCGGLLVDHGWLRIFGGGDPRLPDLATINGLTDRSVRAGSTPVPGLLYVAVDAVGGRFAVDGGGLGIDPGSVCYWGIDTLSWQSLGVGHSDFVHGALDGSLAEAFADLRWDGWEHEVAALAPDQGLMLYPPPFTAEGADRSTVSRRAVPFAELWSWYDDVAGQVAQLPDGQQLRITTTS